MYPVMICTVAAMAIDTGFFKLNITPIAGCEARVCFYRSPDVVMWPSDGK